MSDIDAISNAIATLEEARGIVRDETRGTNDWRYTWWKSSEHTVKQAKEALRRLEQKSR